MVDKKVMNKYYDPSTATDNLPVYELMYNDRSLTPSWDLTGILPYYKTISNKDGSYTHIFKEEDL